MPSIRQMCETIEKAKILEKSDGSLLTAEEIYNYSPTGELFMVFQWYECAIKILEMIDNSPQPM